MSKRRIAQCKLALCPNRFIVNTRGRPRQYCCDAHKQADQRRKQKEKTRTNLELTEDELNKFQAVIATRPEVNQYLERIEKICGEVALIEAIRLMLVFTPTKLTLGAPG